jgi:hypothetical protein
VSVRLAFEFELVEYGGNLKQTRTVLRSENSAEPEFTCLERQKSQAVGASHLLYQFRFRNDPLPMIADTSLLSM